MNEKLTPEQEAYYDRITAEMRADSIRSMSDRLNEEGNFARTLAQHAMRVRTELNQHSLDCASLGLAEENRSMALFERLEHAYGSLFESARRISELLMAMEDREPQETGDAIQFATYALTAVAAVERKETQEAKRYRPR